MKLYTEGDPSVRPAATREIPFSKPFRASHTHFSVVKRGFSMSCVLSVDIGGSKLAAGIVGANGAVLSRTVRPLPAEIDTARLSKIIAGAIQEVSAGLLPSAVGVTVPGLCDAETRVWRYAPFSGIADFAVGELLHGLTGLPVFAENDVNACALAERRFGACRDVSDYLWVTVSNGIGGSLFLNGRLYTGSSGNAGEIGHIRVAENGRLCGCGRRGCLEAEASGRAIAAKYQERTGAACSAKEIAAAAKAGDREARAVYDEAGFLIGKAVSAAVNLLNPAAVVFGGGVSMDFSLLETGLRRAAAKLIFSAANEGVRFVQTALGYDAALLGGAALAL